MIILLGCNKNHKIYNLATKINQHKGHHNLCGKPKLGKTTDGDNRKIHYMMGEYKDWFQNKCPMKRPIRWLKNHLKTLSQFWKNSGIIFDVVEWWCWWSLMMRLDQDDKDDEDLSWFIAA